MIAYKLLNRNLTTYGGCQWTVGETKRTSGSGDLCGPGWLHGYEHAEIAHFLNPAHANFQDPVMYRVEAGGARMRDGDLKSGWTEMTLIERMECPIPTTVQRIRFAIACSTLIYREVRYIRWARRWLSGSERSAMAAGAMAASAGEARGSGAVARTMAAGAMAASAGTERGDSLVLAARFAMSDDVYPIWLQEVEP